MKHFANSIIAIVLVLCSTAVYSQDIIILKTGDEIQAKVEEIKPDVVTYRKFENIQGPLYTIEKTKVFMIKYANGSKDVFSDVSTSTPAPAVSQTPTPSVATPPQIPQNNVQKNTPTPLIYVSGGTIRMNNNTLNSYQIKDVLRPYPEAFSLYSSGRSLKITGDVFEGVGYGFVFAAILYSLDENQVMGNTAAGFAIASLGTSIVLEAIGKSNMRKAVKMYNSTIVPTSHLYMGPGTVGYCLRF